ncbi:glycosyltransferase [Neiella marina]|uniref:Glycosyltransferase n=1 Tax=Neiella holothuriorum TaxID=2870530 RepID=A0ABS7EGY8_9GAMM|nr:glycosyltransferase [Neiella holothuriorum]MBW8191614.1 glycosyltransferase [Neiella holothuriorum]
MMKTVTIGMPLYNNGRTLRRAVDSILAQTHTNFKLILSDDGSSDDTWAICEDYQRLDDRIEIIRQEKNLYYKNFFYLVERADTDYFCWLAGDDYLAEDFLTHTLNELEQDLGLISCNSQCQFENEDGSTFLAKGAFSIEQDDKTERLVSYLSHPFDNSRMYGVFRRQVILDCFPDEIFHAYDWALSALTLCYGKQRCLSETLMFREKTPTFSYSKMLTRDHRFFLYRAFPVLYMSFFLLKHKQFPINFRTVMALLKLNFKKREEYLRNR